MSEFGGSDNSVEPCSGDSIIEAQETSEGRREDKSKLSRFFSFNRLSPTQKTAKCNLCSAKNVTAHFKMTGGGTSTVNRHLKSKHPKEYEQIFGPIMKTAGSSKGSQMTITDIFEKKVSMVLNFFIIIRGSFTLRNSNDIFE